MAAYDIVGDIHGMAGKLLGLLGALGWVQGPDGVHRHPDPERQAIFVGDLVDRGEDQRLVLHTVRAMVEAGTAQIVMGNHELNAVAFHTPRPDSPGEHLRPHSDKNTDQHDAFLTQLDAEEREGWIEWFASLPLWLDLGGVRVVHACWHDPSMATVVDALGGSGFPPGVELWKRASDPADPLGAAVEVLLKGPEVELAPLGLPPYLDKGGHERTAARISWWRSGTTRLADLVQLPPGTLGVDGKPYPPIPDRNVEGIGPGVTYDGSVPVVYGHYWRSWPPAELVDWTDRTACVDFSAGKGGPLVAYCWRGEAAIDPSHFVAFPAPAADSPLGA